MVDNIVGLMYVLLARGRLCVGRLVEHAHARIELSNIRSSCSLDLLSPRTPRVSHVGRI